MLLTSMSPDHIDSLEQCRVIILEHVRCRMVVMRIMAQGSPVLAGVAEYGSQQ